MAWYEMGVGLVSSSSPAITPAEFSGQFAFDRCCMSRGDSVQEGGAGRAGNTTQSTNDSSAPSEDGLMTTAERSTLVAVGQGGDGQRS